MKFFTFNTLIACAIMFSCNYSFANTNSNNALNSSLEEVVLTCGTLDGIYFYDQATDQPTYGPIVDGAVIDLANLPTEYYLAAHVSGAIESVTYWVDGYTSSENIVPFTFPGGAENGNNWTGGVGTHNVDVNAYNLDDADGDHCGQIWLTFEIINNNGPCNNVNTAGSIGVDGAVCAGASYTIQNITLPSGGLGDLEYVWLFNPNSPSVTGHTPIVSNTSSLTINPTESGYYRRCARRANCTNYDGESNWVFVEVTACCSINISANVTPNSSCDDPIVQPPSSCLCLGKMREVTFQYSGNSNATINVYNNINLDILIQSFSNVNSGDVITTNASGFGDGRFLSKTYFELDGQITEIHTSCSQNITGLTIDNYLILGYVDGEWNACGTAQTNNCNGSIDLNIIDGTAPYTIMWSNGSTSEDIDGLCNGDYAVSITDANGCSATQTYSVTNVPGDLNITSSIDHATICDGIIINPPSSCLCNGRMREVTFKYIGASNSTINIYDNISQNVLIQTFYNVNYGDILTTNAAGYGDGRFLAKTYFQSNGQLTEIHTSCSQNIVGLTLGSYEILGYVDSDWNECGSSNSENCNGSIDLTVTSGASPYSFIWSNGSSTEDLSGLCPGTYSVIVIDANGCQLTETIEVLCNECTSNIITDLVLDVNVSCEDDLPIVTFQNGTVTNFEEYPAIQACTIELSSHADYNWRNFWFHSFPTIYDKNFVWDEGFMVVNPDSTAEIFGTVYNNTLTNSGYNIHYYFEQLEDHTTWIAGGGYNSTDTDAPLRHYAQVDFTKPNSIVGFGEFANSDLEIVSTGDVAFMDLGPRDVYGGYGVGYWIDYSGTVNGYPAGNSLTMTAANHNDMYASLGNCTTEPTGDCVDRIIREWTILDECGIEQIFLQNVTIDNSVAPVATNAPGDVTLTCTDNLPTDEPTFSDNCGQQITVVPNETTLALSCGQQITRTWTATSDCGLSTTVSQTITITDTEAPNGTPIANVTISCEDALPTTTPVFTDDCDNALDIAFEEVFTDLDCGHTYVRTWIATDDCGNVGTPVIQTISVIDNVAPVFTTSLPTDLTVDCFDEIPVPATVNGSDNCGMANISFLESVPSNNCNDNFTRTWTVTDECGNSIQHVQNISIEDNIAPVLSDYPSDITIECIDDLPSIPTITATDNCGSPNLVYSEDLMTNGCGEGVRRIWTATDACGNEIQHLQSIFVIDTTAPTGTDMTDASITCEDNLPTDAPTFADNCDNNLSISFNEVSTDLSCGYQLVKTWFATDFCGNVSPAVTQTITVTDNTAPTGTPLADITISTEDSLPTDAPAFIDNCDTAPAVTFNETTNTLVCGYEIVRTWFATDNCGNVSATITQTITVLDNNAPTIQTTVPTNVDLSCDEGLPTDEPTFTDNFDNDLEVTSNEVTNTLSCGYELIRTWFATDDCGNVSATVTQTITVTDTTAPTGTTVANVSIDCEDSLPTDAPTFTDDCDNDLVVTFDEVLNDLICGSEYIRTWFATDDCGNISATITQVITLTDTTAPTFDNTPTDETYQCLEDVPAAVTPTATDNCGQVSINYLETPVSGSCNQTMTRTWIAMDECGNSSSVSQTITINDTTTPVLSEEPVNFSIECFDELPPAPVVTATDNCDDNPTLTYTEDPTTDGCGEGVRRIWTATDACGNVTEHIQSIFVIDTTAPTGTPLADVSIDCEEPLPTDTPAFTDNCDDDLTITFDETFNDLACGSEYIRTWIATDFCGNTSATITQVITLTDTTAPTFDNDPTDETYQCLADVPAAPEVTATDNCGQATMNFLQSPVSGNCNQTITRTWTAIDECGNAASITQTIEINDNTAPTLDVAADTNIDCNGVIPEASYTATDNCGNVEVEVTEETVPGSCPQQYVLQRTYVATDDCGNQTVRSQVINVNDSTSPTLTVADDVTLNCDENIPAPDSNATDDCGIATTTVEEETILGSCPQSYVIIRTYHATDECGNETIETQTLTIEDNEAPNGTALTDVSIDCAEALPTDEPTFTDNCDNDLDVTFEEILNDLACGSEYIRTWFATDDCGNQSATITQVITLSDNDAPVFDNDPTDESFQCLADVTEAPEVTATDNCGEVSINFLVTPVSGDCDQTITRTWTAMDECGNTSSVSQTIVINDTTAPELSDQPANFSIECFDELPPAPVITATDNCDDNPTITFNEDPTTDGCGEGVRRTWTATDACGNVTEYVQSIFVIDTTAPTGTELIDVTVECDAPLPTDEPTFTDNCDDNVTISYSEVLNDFACGHEIIRSWFATDFCGNISETVTQTITVTDTTPPVINAGDDMTIECGDPIPAPSHVATDNCGDVEVSLSGVTPAGCGNTNIITRTCTATDACGNTATDVQVITIVDTTAPVASNEPVDITIGCQEELPNDEPSFTDLCDDDVAFVLTQNTVQNGATATTTKIWTATDDCGNVTIVDQIITQTCEFDLALTKVLISAGPFGPGTEVTYSINVINQGTLDATSISIIDYTPVGMMNNDTDWNADNTFDVGSLAAGQMTTVELTLTIDADFTGGDLTNFAEIKSASNGLGLDDIDSTPDMDNTNDAGGQPDSNSDNSVDGDGTGTPGDDNAAGDEDDHDPATLNACDAQGPVVECPADETLPCNANLPPADPSLVNATDPFGIANVIFVEDIETLNGCTLIVSRIYRATDNCGNSTDCTQTFTIPTDTEGPVLSAQPANITIECIDDLPAIPAITATDNCGTPTLEFVEDPTTDGCGEGVRRTWTATDACGNITEYLQSIFVIDTTAPTGTAMNDVTVECDAPLPTDEPTFTDNCDDNVTVSFSEIINDFACGHEIIRSWFATDFCGNISGTVTQVITVTDTTPPIINAGDDMTIECGDPIPAPSHVATDNCGDVDVSLSGVTPAGCGNTNIITRTCTATDACGNTATDVQVITIIDTTAPVASSEPADVTIGCQEELPTDEPSFTDTCDDDVAFVLTQNTVQNGATLTTTKTWTATDDCGNETVVEQVITQACEFDLALTKVLTSAGPFGPGDNVNYNINVINQGTLDATSVTIFDYVPAGMLNNDTDWNADGTFDLGALAAGQSATVEITLTIDLDFTGGDLVNFAEIKDATNDLGIDDIDSTPDMDNTNDAGGQPDSSSDNAVDGNGSGTPGDDNATGDEDDHDPATLNACDAQGPTVQCPDNEILPCNADAPAADPSLVIASDPFGIMSVVFLEDNETFDGCTKIISRIYRATDNCGNSTDCTQTFTIPTDSEAPVLSNYPTDFTVQCLEDVPPAENITATDNCTEPVTVTFVEDPTDDFCGDGIRRTWTAIDACGNETSHLQSIFLNDTMAPVAANIPQDIEVECTDDLPTDEPTFTDNCSFDITVTMTQDTVFLSCGYDVTKTWTAVDHCENETVIVQVINVVDTTPPTIVAGEDMTIECGDPIPAPSHIASDECGEVSVTISGTTPPGCGNTQMITRLFIATDECGNTATDVQVITIVDTTDPVFTSDIPSDITVECLADVPTADVLTAEDNCGNAVVVLEETSANGSCQETIIRTWTATDECGNETSVQQIITINDTTAPVASNEPANATIGCQDDLPTDEPTFTDNCDNDVEVSLNENTVQNGATLTTTKIWIATDDCGNETVVDQVITQTCEFDLALTKVLTSTGPFGPGDDVTYLINVINQGTLDATSITLFDYVPAGMENNDTDWNADGTYDVGALSAGQSTSVEVTITIDPDFTGGDLVNFAEIKDASNELGIDDIDSTPDMDNTNDAGGQPDSSSDNSVNGDGSGTPGDGNAAGDEDDHDPATLNACDAQGPIVECPSDELLPCNSDTPVADPSMVTATDPAGIASIVFVQDDEIYDGCIKTITRTYRATDNCGNSTDCVQTITIPTDFVAPELSAYPANFTVQCLEEIPPAENITATDNCSENVTVVYVEDPTDDFCGDGVRRTWTATDECGNVTSHLQSIFINDTTAPVAIEIVDVEIECGDALPTDAPTFTDNCVFDIVVTMEETTIDLACGSEVTRTWTATDHCGNTTTSDQLITIIDTTAPVLSGVPNDMTIECDDIPGMATVSATDICDGDIDVTMTETISDGCPYEMTRTYTAIDACGNAASLTHVITVVDTNLPELIGVPADINEECISIPVAPEVTATDACSGDLATVFTETIISNTCPLQIERTWTATDACGNVASATQSIIINDSTGPQILTVLEDVTAECTEVPEAVVLEVSDNCDADPTVVLDEQTIDAACGYFLIRNYSVTDICGNITTASYTVTVVDTQAPVFSNSPPNVTVSCGEVPNSPAMIATDACDGILTVSFSQFGYNGTDCSGTLTRIWSAEDACGNDVSHTQIITIVDNEAPLLVAPLQDVTISCQDNIPNDLPGYTDNCDNDIEIASVDVTTDLPCGMMITRTFTATDDCANTSTTSQAITILDMSAPSLVDVPADATVECNAIPEPSGVTATDDCSEVTVTMTEDISDGCPYEIVRIWSATDECGNNTQSMQTLTVVDSTIPEFVDTPANETVECDNIPVAPIVTAIDNCSDALVTFDEVISDGCPYEILRTWTATDVCGNEAMYTQVITVADTIDPILSNVPADFTAICGSAPAAPTVLAMDNCSGSLDVIFNEEINSASCPISITRTWTAMDACGNQAIATQNILIDDEEAPVLSDLPQNVTVECSAIPAPVVLTASDNCSTVIVTFNEVISDGCPYEIQRTWTSSDDCGNTTSHTQTLTVVDTEAPVLSGVPADISEQCGTVPAPPVVIATDNCSFDLDVQFSEELISTDCPMIIERTWTAMDACGNQISETQTITFNDDVDPVLNGVPANATIECDNIPALPVVTATDNCDTDPLVEVQEITNIGNGCTYEINRFFTATDACGNSTQTIQTLTVTDSTDPVASNVPQNVTIECGDAIPTDEPSFSDNCDTDLSISFNDDVVPSPCGEIIVKQWIATDECGNSTIVNQLITIDDTTDPAVDNGPANVTIDCSELLPEDEPMFTDICDQDLTVELNETIQSNACGYVLTRTWTATDDCNNSANYTQTIIVTDGNAPIISVPANETAECDNIPAAGTPIASDLCDEDLEITMIETETSGCPYTIMRTWTATDDCGNSSSATQVITIEDTQDPVLSAAPADVTVDCGSLPEAALLTATDNCSSINVVMTETTNFEVCPFTVSRTWTATDACGNVASATQLITLTDNEPPTLVDFEGAINVQCDETDQMFITAIDNCSDPMISIIFEQTFSGACYGTIERIYMIEDICGNSIMATQYLFLQDDDAPVFDSTPVDEITILCGDPIPAFEILTAYDNCDTAVVILVNDVQTNGGNCPYVITRTYTAQDQCGNETDFIQTINVIGNPLADFGDVIITSAPNPFSTNNTITMTVPRDGYVHFTVANTLGQEVEMLIEGELEAEILYKFQLETSAWDDGIYYLKLYYNDKFESHKIMKVR